MLLKANKSIKYLVMRTSLDARALIMPAQTNKMGSLATIQILITAGDSL